MCDFKPGDEIVAVDDGGDLRILPALVVGAVYVCTAIDANCAVCADCGSDLGVQIAGVDCSKVDYCVCSFRKVERRNDRLSIEAFLTIKPGQFEEPRRPKDPAKKRERVQ